MRWLSGCLRCGGLSGWNSYKGKISDLWSGNRGRDSKIMSGLLDIKKSIHKVMGEVERSH